MAQRARTGTRLQPHVRRGQIVDAAARVFEAHDPAAVTFEAIADEAGVSRALVYKHFGDRGGLLAAVYVRTADMLADELRGAFASTLEPAQLAAELVRRYLQFASTNAATWRFLQLAGALHHPAVQDARRKSMQELAAFAGGSSEARLVAYGVVGLLEAATLDWLDTGDVDIGRATAVLADLVWAGMSSLPRHGIALRV